MLAIPRSAVGLPLDTRRLIETARRLGVLVAYFTVNDPAEVARLFHLGADAVITDYPSTALRLLGSASPSPH